jgi:acetyl-CoA carboxylase carboxyltransferase component
LDEGNIPVEGGVYAAHRREIEASDDPEACLEKLQETYRAIASPFRTTEAFGIEDIIDPRDTRSLLCEWVEMAYEVEQNKLAEGPQTASLVRYDNESGLGGFRSGII